jgi:hypothetical protein
MRRLAIGVRPQRTVGGMTMTRLSSLLIGLAWAVLPINLALAASSTAVEYFHGGYGHYFVTALPAEISALDTGLISGWARTGQSFYVLALNDPASANVCRFWSGQTFAPKSSHFYTPFDWECAIVKGNRDWGFEGDVFAMMLPAAAGACAGGTIPLYRLYKDGMTQAPNHRYTTSWTIRAEMLALGWIAEGSGIGVIGCVPVHTPSSVTIESPTLVPWVDESVLFTAVGRDASGAAIPSATATWSSSNPVVATISSAGVLLGVTTGSVEVTATINGVSGSQALTITPMPRIGVAIGAAKELVFDYTTDRCYDLDLPDQPARFVRAEDGSLVLIDGNAPRAYISRGADFNSLKRDCRQPSLVSALRPTPESYESMEWLWAVYRDGDRWHALIHNEYHDPVATACLPGDPTPANRCWYNSITYAVSTDGARSFTKPFAPAHVVAPAPNAWVPPPSPVPNGEYAVEGYFNPSNIVRANDGYYYSFLMAIPTRNWSRPQGLCVFRTATLDEPASWRAWDGNGFSLRMTSPYVTGSPAPVCTFLQKVLTIGHVVYSTYLERYLFVSPAAGASPIDGRSVCGFFFSLSADLIHWTNHKLLAEAQLPWCAADPQRPWMLESVPVMYPSIVDHLDTTINFERAGRSPYLYYTRMNEEGTFGDVVRVPLTFNRLD